MNFHHSLLYCLNLMAIMRTMNDTLRAYKAAITVKTDIHNFILTVLFTVGNLFLGLQGFIYLIIFDWFLFVGFLLINLVTCLWFICSMHGIGWYFRDTVFFMANFPILGGFSILRLINISRSSNLLFLSSNWELINLIYNIFIQISANFTRWTYNWIRANLTYFRCTFDAKIMTAFENKNICWNRPAFGAHLSAHYCC